MGASLADLLRNQTVGLEGGLVLQLVRGVARGMGFLHACRPPVVHGDLRASSVLVRLPPSNASWRCWGQ